MRPGFLYVQSQRHNNGDYLTLIENKELEKSNCLSRYYK